VVPALFRNTLGPSFGNLFFREILEKIFARLQKTLERVFMVQGLNGLRVGIKKVCNA